MTNSKGVFGRLARGGNTQAGRNQFVTGESLRAKLKARGALKEKEVGLYIKRDSSDRSRIGGKPS